MTINGSVLRDMVLAGAAILEKNKKSVDALNVFPVPDGDTGINMSLTIASAAREVAATTSQSVGDVAQALAKGALMGARGNSGVILSQIFRGFQRVVDGNTTMDAALFAQALRGASETAYKAVMKPREGTILTIIRTMAEEAQRQQKRGANLPDMLDAVLKEADIALQKTPDMLPVLKEAGVVDAGGVGLMLIFTGFKRALDGEEMDDAVYEFTAAPASQVVIESEEDTAQDIEFGYCTEFFVTRLKDDVSEQSVDRFREKLSRIGDSLIVVGDESLIKVHVHTNDPGKALQFALRMGELSKIKIDNMREQHRSITMDEAEHAALSGGHTDVSAPEKAKEPPKEFGMVAVAMGSGIAQIFQDLMVDEVVEGGQTMNPSIQDIAEAAKRVNAKHVFVLPNNPNIILAAQQAAELCDFTLGVIPSRSIPQGIAASLALHPDLSFDENMRRMSEAIGTVKTGQITYAVRDSTFDGKEIHSGDIMGLAEGKIRVVGRGVDDVAMDLLADMADVDSEILTLFYGSDVTEEDATALCERIAEQYPDFEVELHSGGQPLYYYILSLE